MTPAANKPRLPAPLGTAAAIAALCLASLAQPCFGQTDDEAATPNTAVANAKADEEDAEDHQPATTPGTDDDNRGDWTTPKEDNAPLGTRIDPAPSPAAIFPSGPPSEFRGPDVTLIAGEERTVHEYRHNGQLRMIKVVPKRGKPYYLVPRDHTRGWGDLEQADALQAEWVLWEF